jgi:hypothetical protein
LTGQNNKVVEMPVTATIDGCKARIKKASATHGVVSLRLSGVSGGKLTVTGASVIKSTRTLKAADEATIKAKLTAKTRATLRRVGHAKVAVTVRFVPQKGKAVTLHKSMLVRR